MIFNKGSFEIENINSNCMINFFNDYERQFFTDSAYLNMEYNESEIFRPKSVYDKFIKKQFNLIKNNKSYDQTSKFEKNLKYGKYKKDINLTLDSMEISFKDISLASNLPNKAVKFNIPFSLLPIFYYKGLEAFINFLAAIIKVENNFEIIYFDQEKINEALNRLKAYKDEKTENNEAENCFEFDIFLRKNIKIKKPIQLKPQILKKTENIWNYNYFLFFWATNTKTFAVSIKLPCIHLNILENKIDINHFIDYELLFYLYQKEFINWEFYIIKYFSTYLKFRNIFQQIGSKSKIYNQTIYLKEPKTKINSFTEEILINIYTDQFNNNQLLSFKSFYVKASIIDLNYHQEENYHIHFNFMHYVKLYQISEYSSKVVFLTKFIEVNKEFNTLDFNFEEFEKFNIETWIKNINEFSKKTLNKKEEDEELFTEFSIFHKLIKVEFKAPSWSIIKLENDNEIKKNWEIGKDLEKDLVDSIVDSGSDSWTKLLNECLEKVNEPVPVLPIINKKKIVYKKHSKKNIYLSSDLNKRYKKRFSKLLK